MDPGSFFLLLIVAVVFVGGGVVLLVARLLAGRDTAPQEPGQRPLRHSVSSEYHEHADFTAAGRERDLTIDEPEHQADDA